MSDLGTIVDPLSNEVKDVKDRVKTHDDQVLEVLTQINAKLTSILQLLEFEFGSDTPSSEMNTET